jgi:hypothetical protein
VWAWWGGLAQFDVLGSLADLVAEVFKTIQKFDFNLVEGWRRDVLVRQRPDHGSYLLDIARR